MNNADPRVASEAGAAVRTIEHPAGLEDATAPEVDHAFIEAWADQWAASAKRPEIRYSLGTSKFDAHPTQHEAPDFDALEAAVLATRSVKKGEHYICAPCRNDDDPTQPMRDIGKPHRGKAFALRRRWLAFDLDGCRDAGAFRDILAYFDGSYRAFWYTTASHTDESPRARIIVELDCDVSPEDGERLGHAVEARIRAYAGDDCAKFDASVYRAEQPVYTPLWRAETGSLPGAPLPVDEFMREAPRLAPRVGTQERAQAIQSTDPVVALLQDQGAILRELGPGKLAVRCPFDSDHSDHTSDTATVYLLPHFAGVRHGKFHCLHAHCADRTQEEFLERLGLEPRDVWRSQAGGAIADELLRRAHNDGTEDFGVFSASDLDARQFAPLQFAARGLIPEGATIVAGRPKMGKTTLVHQIIDAKARGFSLLDGQPEEPAEALFIALEDSERRLQDRQRRVAAGPGFAGVHYATTWEKGEAGVAKLSRFLTAEPKVRIVVIDTLQRFRGPVPRNADKYAADYAALGEICALAYRHRVSVVLIHHTRKGASSDDPMEAVSGTFGITGAVDTVLVMTRRTEGDADAILHVEGRDIESADHVLRRADGRWQFTGGDAAALILSDTRRKIMQALQACPDGASAQDIAATTGNTIAATKMALGRMVEDGTARRAARGLYTPVTSVTSLPAFLSTRNTGNARNTHTPSNGGNSVCRNCHGVGCGWCEGDAP